MYLLVDWGNTRLKYLIIDHLSLLIEDGNRVESYVANSADDLIANVETAEISQVLVASVRDKNDNLKLQSRFDKLGLSCLFAKSSHHAAGVSCAYQNPELLGIDRWLAVIGAYHKQYTTGVFDLGSAVTLDVVNDQGIHLGGHIIPGRKLIQQSLSLTANVKIQNIMENQMNFKLGVSTDECVNFGIDNMLAGYLMNCIKQSEQEYQVDRWLITGGDADIWLEYFRQDANGPKITQLVHRPNLVFRGLALIFEAI